MGWMLRKLLAVFRQGNPMDSSEHGYQLLRSHMGYARCHVCLYVWIGSRFAAVARVSDC